MQNVTRVAVSSISWSTVSKAAESSKSSGTLTSPRPSASRRTIVCLSVENVAVEVFIAMVPFYLTSYPFTEKIQQILSCFVFITKVWSLTNFWENVINPLLPVTYRYVTSSNMLLVNFEHYSAHIIVPMSN